jgi:hypothetical protein
LAGFAVAAVILVMQLNIPDSTPYKVLMRDWASIAFLVAFFGCMLSSFIFSVVTGEEILARRTTMVALFGGIGMSISTSLVFWGLVTLTKVFLDPDVVELARIIYPVFILILPAYLSFSALDNIYLFEGRKPNRSELIFALGPSYAPPLIAVLLKYTVDFSFTPSQLVPVLWCTALLSVAIIILSSIGALVASDKDHWFELAPKASWPAIFVHSLGLALLILII